MLQWCGIVVPGELAAQDDDVVCRMAVLTIRGVGPMGYRAAWPLYRHHDAAMASFHCGTPALAHDSSAHLHVLRMYVGHSSSGYGSRYDMSGMT